MVYNNAANINPTGLVKADGSGGFTGVTVTQHDVLVGAASNGITSVAPSATSGVPLISQGASSDPAFGTAVVAGGGTGIVSGTAYGVVCAGTTSTAAFQVVTPGTSGYVLESGGAGGLPTWVANTSAGNFVLIQSQTVTSSTASISFTTGITATYNTYIFYISNVLPVSSNATLQMQVSANGGSSYIATGYGGGYINVPVYTASAWGNSAAVTTYVRCLGSLGTAQPSSACILECFDVTNGNDPVFMSRNNEKVSGAGVELELGASNITTTTLNAFQFSFNSGNIATAIISLYGLLE